VLKDDLSAPSSDASKVRFIHLGIGASEVDIYFYTGDVQPDAMVNSLGYGRVFPSNASLSLGAGSISAPVESTFTTLPLGTYNYAIRPAGADPGSIPLQKGTVTLAAGRVYSIIVRGYAAPPDGVTNRGLSVLALLHERIL